MENDKILHTVSVKFSFVPDDEEWEQFTLFNEEF